MTMHIGSCPFLVIILSLISICTKPNTASTLGKRAVTPQNPPVWDALSALKGVNNGRALTTEQMQELFYTAHPGEDFPLFSQIPPVNFDCTYYNQPGFYADTDVGRCQVFHRCDIQGNLTSYLCPNMTLFNQITLVCDWWFNVDCSQSKRFMDYSNSRLYQGEDVHLLDDQDVMTASGAIAQSGYERPPKRGPKPVPKAKKAPPPPPTEDDGPEYGPAEVIPEGNAYSRPKPPPPPPRETPNPYAPPPPKKSRVKNLYKLGKCTRFRRALYDRSVGVNL